MSKIPAINEIDANSPSQESTEVVVKATTVTPNINEIQETISAAATIQEIDGTRKPTISEIYKIVNDGLFESTTNWWDYAYKLSQAQLNQDIISRLDNGVIGGGYSKGADIITTTSNKVPSNTNVYSALKSDSLYPKKLNDEVINGIYDFLNGLTIGKPTAYTGGTWSVDQIGRTHLTTDYLYVRLKAIFETLQILNVDTIGGKLVISPAGSIRVAYVDKIKIDAPVFTHNEETDVWSISQVEDAEGNLVNETLNQEVYRCYFLGEQDGEEVENKWKVGDQAQAKTFNVKKGTYHKVENSYLWRLVVNVSSDTVDIDGKKYHYVDLSQIDFDSGSDAPAPGDVLNQLGHRLNDTQRQTALILNAVDNFAPSITLYAGINYYTFLNKEYVEFGVYNGKAFFNVYGDMYIGDKGTNPKTYIKYKNGKINIKANLEIGSSIGDKDLDQYIKENGGVDEETVKNLINNAQVIKDLQKQTDGAIETWFYEGVPTPNNYPFTDKENKGDVLTYNIPGIDWYNEDINNYNAIKDSDKYTEAEKEAIKVKARERHIGDLYYDQKTGYAYRFTRYDDDIKPYRWNVISDSELTKILEAANRAQATADGKMKVFYGETKPTNYQVGDMWVNATLEGKFNNDIGRAVAKSESFNADDWVLASRYSEAIATIQKWTNEYETKFGILAEAVKNQKDQSIIVWYLEYEPTLNNLPASGWNENDKSEHIGDIVYDIKNNHSYRWTGSAWVQIKDADFNEAMKAAKAADDKAGAAGDLADSKRRIFYSDVTPTKPFDKGDLWIKQVKGKTETWVYNGTDWVKSEDKDLADFSYAINKELVGIKGQIDGKAETWYQNTDPRNEKTGVWESGGTDKSHKGDIWYDTTNGTTKYWTGSAWEKMDIPKDVFDTIDGKSSIFVDSYDEAKAGTGIINKGYKERDLWILPADATVNGTAYYKGDMLTATSTNTKFDETNWERKVRYIGPTELTSAIDVVNKKITDITNTTIPGINDKFNKFVEDGVLDSSEKARLTDLLNQASNEVAAVVDQVNNIITSKYLTNDNANKGKLEEANTVMNTAWTEYKKFINTLIDANTKITKVNIGEANTKYKVLQEKIKAVKQYLAICQADVLSGIGSDISSYKYLKEAFKGKTEVNGGLVVTNVLQLRQTSDASSPVTAGISGLQGKANANGVVDKDTYDITSIAAWFGGPMVDKDIFTDEQLNNKVAGTDYARSLFRHDGSGYLASGAIYWGTDGVLHGDPNSFILQGTSIATMFYYVRLFYLHNPQQGSTDFNKIAYVTPMKTFSRLSVLPLGGKEHGADLPTGLFIGDSNTGGSFQIGNIILRTKSGDPNILEIVSADSKKTAHLGVQGGVSAYGTYTPSTGGGGGLNGTIVPYNTAIASDPQNEGSKIASASSIYKLHSRISSIENNGATSITVTGTGNAITSVSKNGTSITFTKGATFLTSHQSLANYYTKSSVDSLLSGKSATSHTHSVKINGVTKTIEATGGAAVDLGTYLTSHQSLADYAKKTEIPTKVSQLTNDTDYITSSGSCAYATSAGNADKVDGVHVTWAGELTSTNHLVAWEADGSALRGIKPANVSVGNSDKLDGIHANGLLTALSNSDKGISITVGGTTKSVSNISVNYASSAGNADTVDGYHASHLLVKRGRLGAYNIDKETTFGTRDIQPESEVTISGKRPFNGWGTLLVIGSIDGASNHQLAFTGDNRMFIRCAYGTSNNYNTKDWATVALTSDNVASATKLATARTIWGQSFDGTGNVDGTLTITNSGSDDPHIISTVNKWFHIVSNYKLVLYAGDYNSSQRDAINILSNHNVGIGVDPSYKLHVAGDIYSSATIRTAAKNQAIMLTNDANPAWISALDGQIIFNTGKAIRFGETAWDWAQWAGLKYNHSNKIIYLGIADGSVFNTNSVQNGGTLKFPGITTITPDSGARIGGSGNLYLGNANNSGWVYVQDMCSQLNSTYWRISQNGIARFKSLNVDNNITCGSITINGDTRINGSTTINSLLTAKAINATTADVNAFGTRVNNWDGSIGANVTNMFNGIDCNNISLEYSANGGSSWLTYTANPNYLFNLINDNSDTENFYLGNNDMSGSSDADKLTQIKKNQLRVTIKIPPEVYQELSWISVDVNNGVDIKCQVYFGNSSGVYTEYVSKVIIGWSHRCDICVGPSNVNVGNDTYRYVRLVFSHPSNNTDLRNGIVSRIRALGLTKYNNPSGRYNISTTGHIYNFDYNMNTYFPNSILAKGGVTAYQSSDIRLKQDLRKLDYLGIIKAMGGTYGFAWKKDNTRSIGWIAQHVLCNPHLKDIVETDEKGYYKINYWSPKLIATAFGAIEQVGDEVSRLKARVVFLESEVQRLSGDKEDCNKKRLDNKNINLLN
nr:MAG TPA: Receptor recognition protein, Long tail, Helical sandwich, Tail fiber [Crassvirales sp.]